MPIDWLMKNTGPARKSPQAPAFVLRAAHIVKAQIRARGLPAIVWQDSKVVVKPA